MVNESSEMNSNKRISKNWNFFRNLTAPARKQIPKIVLVCGLTDSAELLTQERITNSLNRPLSTINYYILKLKKEGYIDRLYRLTPKGCKLFQFLKEQDKIPSKKLRAHNIQITLNLARPPKGFPDIQNNIYEPFTNGRYRALRANIANCKIMIYSAKKAVVTLPDIFADSDEDISAALLAIVGQLINLLEEEFEGLKINDYKIAKFNTMHVAVLDSFISESFILDKGHIYKSKGIAVDKSHGRYELESERGIKALEDISYLVDIEELARENKKLRQMIQDIKLHKRLRQ